MYLLDTNILIHHLNERHGISERIKAAGFTTCYVSEISILELLYGVANSAPERQAANLGRVRLLEQSFQGRVLPIRDVFVAFAEQKTRLRQQGQLISDFDLLIGCTALVRGFTLVSINTKEMIRIKGLSVQNWISQD